MKSSFAQITQLFLTGSIFCINFIFRTVFELKSNKNNSVALAYFKSAQHAHVAMATVSCSLLENVSSWLTDSFQSP